MSRRNGRTSVPPSPSPEVIDDARKLLGKRMPPPFGFMEEPNGAEIIREDFQGYGFTEEYIEALLMIEEPDVDAYAQIAHGRYGRLKRERELEMNELQQKREGRESKRLGAGLRKSYADDDDRNDSTYGFNGGAKARQQINLGGSKNWVLFDPLRGFPPTFSSEPPAVYMKYSRYEPGNHKILAYNIESHAVTLRKTPEMLQGRTVQYSKAGPKLAKEKRASRAGEVDS